MGFITENERRISFCVTFRLRKKWTNPTYFFVVSLYKVSGLGINKRRFHFKFSEFYRIFFKGFYRLLYD